MGYLGGSDDVYFLAVLDDLDLRLPSILVLSRSGSYSSNTHGCIDNEYMRELEITKVLEKTKLLDKEVLLAQVETGGFAVACKLDSQTKVAFRIDLKDALDLYVKCMEEVRGGQGFSWYN